MKLDIPLCPTCGESLGIIASYKARLDRYACSRCAARLKVPNKRQVFLAIAVLLLFRQIDQSLPWPRDVLVIAAVFILGVLLEYMTARVVPSKRPRSEKR